MKNKPNDAPRAPSLITSLFPPFSFSPIPPPPPFSHPWNFIPYACASVQPPFFSLLSFFFFLTPKKKIAHCFFRLHDSSVWRTSDFTPLFLFTDRKRMEYFLRMGLLLTTYCYPRAGWKTYQGWKKMSCHLSFLSLFGFFLGVGN